MNEKKHLTLRELSLYYDGLLEEIDVESAASQLKEDRAGQEVLKFFGGIESALQPELSEEEIGSFLDDTLKNVHERLIEEERHTRLERRSVFDWIFAPRNLIGALAGMLILFGIFTSVDPRQFFNHTREEEPSTVSMAQKEAILAATKFTKSAVESGIAYAKTKAEPLSGSIASLPIKTIVAPTQKSTDSNTLPTTLDLLKRQDTQQIAVGMGVSVLSMVSVF